LAGYQYLNAQMNVDGGNIVTKDTCDECEHFISHVTEIDEYGLEIWGYGCMLGGNHLSKHQYFNPCNEFKKREQHE
jgi:hypothetical protein